MTYDEADQRLIAAGAAADDVFPLIDAAIACALHENPERRVEPVHALLERSAGRLRDRLAQQSPQKAIAGALAGDLHIVGDTVTYDHLDNADIISVCERRRGLPVALGVIYIDVAKRCGLDVRGLDFPGHFLLRIETADGPVVIDPFDGGQLVEPSDLTRRALLTGLASRSQISPRF